MTTTEINQGIELLCKTSDEVKQYYQNHDKLVAALNNVPKEELDKCMKYYTGRTGVIVDLRKEVILFLIDGKKLDTEILEAFINKHKEGKENQFRAYKQWFSIFYPPITFYGHTEIRTFTEQLIEQLNSDLNIKDKVESTYFDFQGPRQQGSDRFWLAIYNNAHDSHSSGIQFFIEFIEGNIGYGVYRHSDKNYLKEKVVLSPADFNYDSLLKYFKPEVDLLLDDTTTTARVLPKGKAKKIKNEHMAYNLNTILYGPPGTGKTHNTLLRAAEIVEQRTIINYEEAQEIFQKHFGNQIEFITFHQNYSYEDFIQGLRPDVDNGTDLTFERKDGIFKRIADRALENLKQSQGSEAAKKAFKEVFNDFVSPLMEGEVKELEVKMKRLPYFITDIGDKSISFRKPSGGTAHTLSIATLKRMYAVESVGDIQGLATYYDPLLKVLLAKGKQTGVLTKVEKQNYVLIIDEINRANISRVFGELITLIEPDKRSEGANPLKTILPSGEAFMVPSNLHLIGTMNTADKSIALLDIALRRRFEFEAMYPQYEIKDYPIHDVDILQSMNKEIINKKGHDFQIGHSFFMGDDYNLVDRMNKKVIPLLLEYFMNDDKEVKTILEGAKLIVDEQAWPLKITGKQ